MWGRIVVMAFLLHAATSMAADDFPSRPIRIIDGNPPGGSADFLARVIAPKLAERLGQPVFVENRPGASGNLGADITAHAEPNGYTLMMAVLSTLASSRSLYSKLGYDLLTDFSYVTLVATGAMVLIAHPSMPDSLPAIVAAARTKPNELTYGTPGVATTMHLAMELLQSRAGIQLLHIPYNGTAPFNTAIIAGEGIRIGFTSATAAMPLIEAKRVKPIAVASPKRLEMLPAVPTVSESGYPGFDFRNFIGVIAPAGTPPAVVSKLNVEIRNVLQMPDVAAKIVSQGFEPEGSTPEELKKMTEAAIAQSARLIKEANIGSK